MQPFLIILSAIASLTLLLVALRAIKKHRKQMRRRQGSTWCIGLYEGPDPVTLLSPSGLANPILTARDVTDVKARCIADPFMLKHKDEYYLFFEIVNNTTDRGEIGYAKSLDLRSWKYGGSVLREPFHLSYPYVFRDGDRFCMIPEGGKSGGIHLYTATRFPDQWKRTATLLEGDDRSAPLQDPSVIFHEGRWYLFSYAPKPKNLHLFTAETLEGPWTEHPKSPLVTGSPSFARPGGRVVKHGGAIYRYAQDSVPSYGRRVWGFRITELTPETYSEEPASAKPIVDAGGESWNNRGMHTVDPHLMADGRWIAVVDGIGTATH